ncbi:beta-galactosidase [Purpureocillium lavendulum]|uniref:Beta-galactosidase n=1 Tax=Purpureocillium lavendulum TaxID=1247861 RepID=A0AB34FWW1_9HYPO|nr:beta-galactosidase [Purpureocillium lavendulum]
MKLSAALVAALSLPACNALTLSGPGGRPYNIIREPEKRALQDIVTWDEHSLFIRGERAMMFSGEYHPFRQPVASLHLDVLQKIKAMGFNMVSFYVDWALLEGKRGEFRAEDVHDLEPFFEAAKQAGIYLLARPGPYINAEVSGGGFPGWLQRNTGVLRTNSGDFLPSTDNYMAHICNIIAKHQITNGGPVVLFQPENEYSYGYKIPFPNGNYMQYVIDQARRAGIVMPMINNDVGPYGYYAPGSGTGQMDIYGHDNYPLGFDCDKPDVWPAGKLPTDLHQRHVQQSPKTPYAIVEFQGGSYDPWGGSGVDQCAALVNHEFARVFNKNNLAAGVAIFSQYMIYGGTNWGNLGHPGGYTSYDYGAAIKENRVIDREKYSEIKLQGEFLKVSPNYLLTVPGALSTTAYSDNAAIAVTPLTASNNTGNFYVVRHADYASTDSVSYKMKLSTSAGAITVPRVGGATLTLSRRDSKIHVTDYPVGPDHKLLYSTAEIFTWKKFGNQTVLILYGGAGETHEFGYVGTPTVSQAEASAASVQAASGITVVQWRAVSERQSIRLGSLTVYLLDRNAAYNHWVPVLPANGSAFGSSVMNPAAVIINGGYLIRSASVDGATLNVKADFNKTTEMEVIGAPSGTSKLRVNGKDTKYTANSFGNWVAKVTVDSPAMPIPDLGLVDWHKIDSLPEIQPGYDDTAWPVANHNTSNNTVEPLKTPVSLYASDYGFNAGTLVFRGHFTATGAEKELKLTTKGGSAFSYAVWLNGTFLGSYRNDWSWDYNDGTFSLDKRTTAGAAYVLTVVVDNMGLNEDLNSGWDDMKSPRGILNYAIVSADGAPSATVISPWKLTGNLGGESYKDRFRGPLNEGGLFFERQGYHYPNPPLDKFTKGKGSSPMDGLDKPGVAFYTGMFTLNLPADKYDIPLSVVFGTAQGAKPYRAILYVNGFQFGKLASNIGPQTEFPVPEGIIDHRGDNWIGIAVWAVEDGGAKVPSLKLKTGTPVLTGRETVHLVRGPKYTPRKNTY